MKLAPLPRGNLLATAPMPLSDSDNAAYIELNLATCVAIAELIELLKKAPFELSAKCIGAGVIAQSPTLVQAPTDYWVLERNSFKFNPCEGKAVKLIAAGFPVDPHHIRIAHRMPQGWTPRDTMREVRPQIFLGQVEPGSRRIAVGFCAPTPTKVRNQVWANWVVIDVSRLERRTPSAMDELD